MKQKRILWHILFWLVQFSISLYNDLYLSVSFIKNPALIVFLESATAVFLILLVKVITTYYVLYSLIPKWIKAPGRVLLYVEGIVLILISTLLLRVMTQLVIWRLIYPDEPHPDLSLTQFTARFFYSMLDLLQVVGIASAIKLFKLRIGAIKNEKLLVQEKLRSEILHLKSQVNPHFLFNTINNIYSLARAQSPSTPDAIMRLSKILRYMLYETGEKTIFLNEELQIITNYIELQELRFGKRLKIVLVKVIDDESAQLAPLLLLPLVENAFKHGSHEGGAIEIKLSLEKNQLVFVISNPIAENIFKYEGEDGIGLSNIKRQLELLYRRSSLQTIVKENTFTVELKIDLASYAGFELFDSRR